MDPSHAVCKQQRWVGAAFGLKLFRLCCPAGFWRYLLLPPPWAGDFSLRSEYNERWLSENPSSTVRMKQVRNQQFRVHA